MLKKLKYTKKVITVMSFELGVKKKKKNKQSTIIWLQKNAPFSIYGNKVFQKKKGKEIIHIQTLLIFRPMH